jgi:serine/threonine protein kinase
MTLTAGSRLGPYEIVSTLGAGGMGEVFRARDTKLNRDVAIKVLLPAVASDPDRLARFSREAQVLASLNHPNIAHIHGLEESNGVTALVMELVEGEDLSQRIRRGAIPIDEALAIARQITEALEAAHDYGIIHRDLKPANIKVRPDGTVKVLDFGLAKAVDPTAGSSATAMNSPTLSIHATQAGIILGTAAYMSPEQARGKAVDKRTDIWALGAVLFEMLSGSRAFPGDDATDTIVAVVSKEPDWSALPSTVPSGIRRLLRRALEKDPKRRLDSAPAARIEIDEAVDGPPESESAAAAQSGGRRTLLPWTIAAVALVAASVAVGVLMTRETSAPSAVQRLDVMSSGEAMRSELAVMRLSPDGRQLAFVDTGRGRDRRIWIRSLDGREAEPIRGTDRGNQIFWSADSRQLGYYDSDAIYRVELPNGTPRRVAAAKGGIRGGAWGGGFIYFGLIGDGAIYRVAEDGGTAVAITKPDQSRVHSHSWPELLPGGRQILYFEHSPSVNERGLLVHDLATGANVFVTPASGGGKVVNGHLLYRKPDDIQLRAEPIDPQTFQLSGVTVPIADRLLSASTTGWGGFSVSDTGLIAVGHHAGTRFQLQWIDRSGRLTAAVGTPSPSAAFSLEPKSERIVVATGSASASPDLWLLSGPSGNRVRLTFDTAVQPRWAAKGAGLLYFHNLRPSMPMSLSVGSARPAIPVPGLSSLHRFDDETGDGRLVLVSTIAPVGMLSVASITDLTKLRPLVRERYPAQQGRFSPDGRWVSFTQGLPDGPEVFVQAVDGLERVRISVNGGFGAVWRGDGRELYYESGNGRLMAVPVDPSSSDLRPGTPVELFAIRTQGLGFNQPFNFEPSADGKRFLVNTVVGDSDNAPLEVIVNWPALLKKQ